MSAPPSKHFRYEGGELKVDGHSIRAIAETYGTPLYIYSAAAIREAYLAIDHALDFTPHLIAYAVKANGNLAILKLLAELGSGADIVSGGELARALRAGFSPEKIVYSGVGKTRRELREAIEAGIRAIHVESAFELELIEEIARSLKKKARVAFRVNPNVDPQTHPYISTGLHSSKFGIPIEEVEALLPRTLASDSLELVGLTMHIGSQLGSPEPLAEAAELLGRFACECIEKGARFESLDVGGGWPLAYGDEREAYPPPSAFGDAIRRGLEASGVLRHNLLILTEPGRSLVGDAGVLITEVLGLKSSATKRFIVADAAMTELIRPALYDAYHAVMPVKEPTDRAEIVADLVGPVCESGDFLARDRAMPEPAPGELLAIRGAGAYAREMASTYNARVLAPEILIDGEEARLVRARPSYESLFENERF